MTPQSETITWIPYSERVPEAGKHYLMTIVEKGRSKTVIYHLHLNQRFPKTAIAWAELPKGYQPEKGEE